ncbi:MAG: ABC-2 transporter permease [Ruminococcus sp.]|nr:ABC-2 transporter permease [Ruminococcus sp.]
MLGFLYKDIKSNLKWLLLGLLVIMFMVCLMSLAMVLGDENIKQKGMGSFMKMILFVLEAMSFVIVGAFSLNYIQSDERKKWGYYVASLPCGTRNQVVSKYVFVAGITFITFFICIANNLFVGLFVKGMPDLTETLFSVVCLSLLMRAIELPFIFAFGTKVGSQVKGGIMLMIIVWAAVYFMFGDLSWMGSEDEIWGKLFEWIQGFDFTKLLDTVLGKILLLGLPLYAVSCFISTKVYLRGVERMEK